MSLATAPSKDRLRTRLLKFMSRPQRHRLLHGYPLAAGMPYADRHARKRAADGDANFCLPANAQNELLVGVLPHPFCNPKISGCGFCTFPHETFSNMKSAAVVRAVVQEIDDRLVGQPDGIDAWNRYSERFDVLAIESLLVESDQAFSLTPRGMFFADSIAGFLAESRWQARGDRLGTDSYNDNRGGYM